MIHTQLLAQIPSNPLVSPKPLFYHLVLLKADNLIDEGQFKTNSKGREDKIRQ
jgi:hypothetical protein